MQYGAAMRYLVDVSGRREVAEGELNIGSSVLGKPKVEHDK
jgi:hypothetical protein